MFIFFIVDVLDSVKPLGEVRNGVRYFIRTFQETTSTF